MLHKSSVSPRQWRRQLVEQRQPWPGFLPQARWSATLLPTRTWLPKPCRWHRRRQGHLWCHSTARSPIEPPGNWIGLTTKLSVVIAMGAPLHLHWAESDSDWPARRLRTAGTNKRLNEFAAGFTACAVRHRNLLAHESARRVRQILRRSSFRTPVAFAVQAAVWNVRQQVFAMFELDTLRMSPR